MKQQKPHNRHSIRLKGRDYSGAGAYFVTIRCFRYCAYFDDPDFKRIIEAEWLNSIDLRPNIALDEFVVMPNHIHGIIIVKAGYRNVGAYCDTPPRQNIKPGYSTLVPTRFNNKFRSPSQTLGAIIRGFKAATTRKVNIFRDSLGMPLWQRNYYEHIIRNAGELAHYRQYIRDNPKNWERDELNPHRRR
jgi:REP element-mobilizing transposase RayT